MSQTLRVSIAVLLGWALLASAAEPAGPATEEAASLRQFLQLALERNPRIAASRAQWRATIERVPQARALPDPMVVFDYFGASVETRVGPQEYRYGVSQSFPWPGTLSQAGEVVAKEVRIKHAEYDRAIRDVIVDLRISYHELLYLRGAMAIAEQNQALLAHILQLANARYAEGQAKLADVLKAQSQLAQLAYDVVLLRELEQVEIARLNALLDRPSTTPIGRLAMPPLTQVRLPVEVIEDAAVAGRQEVEIARGVVEKSAEAIHLAKLRNRPMFALSASRIATGESDMPVDESGKDPWMVGVGVSIPLWFDRNRSRVAEAELNHEAALNNQRAVENQTRAEVKSAWFRLENARRLIELYEKSLIPQAKQAMEVAEQWHDGAKRDISGFLETQSVWLNFNLARLRAVTDYQQYQARLERLLGGSLPDEAASEEVAP